MADYVITAASVVPGTNNIYDTTHLAQVALTAGQLVYLNTATNKWNLANATAAATATGQMGIAMAAANVNGPAIVAVSGTITFNAVFTSRSMVVGSGAVAGNLAPHADLVTNIATWFPIFVAIPTSTTVLQLPGGTGIMSTGI